MKNRAPSKVAATMSKAEFLGYEYPLTIEPDEDPDDPGYVVSCDENPGLTGWGKTPAAAIAAFRANRSEWYDQAARINVPLRPPGDVEQASGNLLLRMEPSLHAQLARAAKAEGTSLNKFAIKLLKAGLQAPPADGSEKLLQAIESLAGRVEEGFARYGAAPAPAAKKVASRKKRA